MPFSEVAALLRSVRSRIGAASAHTVVHLVESEQDPDEALAAATEHADLLVIGSRQRSRLQESFGVRSLRLARHENCPTVIVPEAWTPRVAGTVVVGLEEESGAEPGATPEPLEFAAREAARRGARLEVVHAWTPPLPAYDPLVWLVDTEEELRNAHRAHLDATLDRLTSEHPSLRVGGYLEECTPAAALRDRAASADLIVIGSHRDGPILRAILGSTARELLRDAVVPLCIIPSSAVPAPAATAPPGSDSPHPR
jgi:nucleotide-binding universal stress UspA family protein